MSMVDTMIRRGLGEETIPFGESALIDRIVALNRDVQEMSDRKLTPVPRGQHPKQHGCVKATFAVQDGLPEAYRHGIFREPRSYEALIRFSNGAEYDDTKADVHGMAIKLLGIEGEPVCDGAVGGPTQDFIMLDVPVFFIRNVADFVPFMEDFRTLKSPGLSLGKMCVLLKALFSPDYRFRMLRAARKKIDSPLRVQYWSTTPYELGSVAMKFSARPDFWTMPTMRISGGKDRLRLAMSAHLQSHEVRFDFLVQLQTDPVRMPIEDPTVAWDEEVSPYQAVATILIPPQEFESEEQMAFGENLTFTPWHALAEHRPLGGINRARKRVYADIARRRHELNGIAQQEPSP